MGIEVLLAELKAFVEARDWQQFHTPENLVKGISIEAAELLECYQWDSDADLEQVKMELADVLTYCLLLCDKLNLDPLETVRAKLEETKAKYPVEKARGSSTKYDRL
jgi:dCTP diphosphatase